MTKIHLFFWEIANICIPLQSLRGIGKLAEWFKAAVLKTVEVKASGGSNPSLSAKGTKNMAPSLLERHILFSLCIAPPQAGRDVQAASAAQQIPESEG